MCGKSRHARLRFLCDCEQVPTRYSERNGGYCRVQPVTQPRRGDNVEMATIELV
jgi:ribosomal protein L17